MLIRTKLHPPRLGSGLVQRPALEARLDAARDMPFTLVSAPAGYGKSTLVANWLQESECRFAWVTLDATDSRPSSFLTYLAAAFDAVEPGSCSSIREASQAPRLPAPQELASLVVNDLDALSTEMVLVLDDYHLVASAEVHQLLETLLRYPPAPLRLMVVTRFDPPLPLHSLRAKGLLEEIREADLRFSVAETEEYFGLATGSRLSALEARKLSEVTEGWVVGMKMASLLLSRGDSPEKVIHSLERGIDHIRQYLLSEILEALPDSVQEHLDHISVLDRFNEELWQAMAAPDDPIPSITELQSQGLFLATLADGGWFRLHQLLRDTLSYRLSQRRSLPEIATLHDRAAGWLADNGYTEEALRHLALSGNWEEAADLVRDLRILLMNEESWARLDRWLGLLPAELTNDDPGLLLARGWLEEGSHSVTMKDTAIRADAMVPEQPTDADELRLRAEADALNAGLAYMTADVPDLMRRCTSALKHLPDEHFLARGFASACLAFGHQMSGQPTAAVSMLKESLDNRLSQGTTLEGMLLATFAFVHWMEADISRLVRMATHLLRRTDELRLTKSMSYARYILGLAQLEADDLERADETLEHLRSRWLNSELSNGLYGAFAQALVAETQGQSERARALVAEAGKRALEANNAEALAVTEAFEAELAIRQGHLERASLWATSFEPADYRLRNRFYQPELTLIKVRILEGTPEALERARTLVSEVEMDLRTVHAKRHLIDLLSLKALLHEAGDSRHSALKPLREALTLALPGRLKRPFRDLGPRMALLLSDLESEETLGEFAASIFEPPDSAPATSPPHKRPAARNSPSASEFMAESFTDRELEVLTLLSQRFSNKEIAAKLVISPATVKRHNANIFEKLQVDGGRRKAVKRAQSLGVFG